MKTSHRTVACAHEGCNTQIRANQISGLCKVHFDIVRQERAPKCAHCSKQLRIRTINGLCSDCRCSANAYKCVTCGTKVSGQRNLVAGKCHPCRLAEPSIRLIPDDRRPDYNLLRGRGMSAQAAADHINSGAPIVRKFRRGVAAKVTTMEVVRVASEALNISQRDVLSNSRFREAVDCRAVVVETMRRQGVSFCQIGRRLGRDHSSIINLHRGFAERSDLRPILGQLVEKILERAA